MLHIILSNCNLDKIYICIYKYIFTNIIALTLILTSVVNIVFHFSDTANMQVQGASVRVWP